MSHNTINNFIFDCTKEDMFIRIYDNQKFPIRGRNDMECIFFVLILGSSVDSGWVLVTLWYSSFLIYQNQIIGLNYLSTFSGSNIFWVYDMNSLLYYPFFSFLHVFLTRCQHSCRCLEFSNKWYCPQGSLTEGWGGVTDRKKAVMI